MLRYYQAQELVKYSLHGSDQAPQAVAAEVVAVWQVNGFVAACVLQHNFPEVVHDFAKQPEGVVASHVYVPLVF